MTASYIIIIAYKISVPDALLFGRLDRFRSGGRGETYTPTVMNDIRGASV